MKTLIVILLLAFTAHAQTVLFSRSSAFHVFTPANISGLQIWADATQESGSDSTAIEPSDWSGNNRDFAQATSGSRPLLRTGANGINNQNAFQFDGTDDRASATYSQARPHTIFLVYVSTSNTGRTLSSDGVGAGTYNWLFGSHITGSRWWYANAVVGAAGGSTGTTYLLRAEADTGDSEYFSSGVSVASSAATGNWGDHLNMGAANQALDGGGGGNEYFTGKIGEVIVYDRILTSGEVTLLEAYLTDKWFP